MLLKWWVIGVLFLAQVGFAFVLSPLLKTSDAYPLFHWRLFARVHQLRALPMLSIRRLNGQDFEPPRMFLDHFANSNKKKISQLTEDLDHFFEKQITDPSSSNDIAKEINHKYFADAKHVEFEIFVAEVDQLDFFLNRTLLKKQRTLGVFEFQK